MIILDPLATLFFFDESHLHFPERGGCWSLGERCEPFVIADYAIMSNIESDSALCLLISDINSSVGGDISFLAMETNRITVPNNE